MGYLKASVAAHGYQAIETEALEVLHNLIRDIAHFDLSRRVFYGHLKGVAFIGRSEDSPSDARYAAHIIGRQADDLIGVQEPGIAVFDAVYLPVPVISGKHDRLDYRIKPRCVSPAGIDRYPHHFFHKYPPLKMFAPNYVILYLIIINFRRIRHWSGFSSPSVATDSEAGWYLGERRLF